jgi:pentatricopeptide repeat protein
MNGTPVASPGVTARAAAHQKSRSEGVDGRGRWHPQPTHTEEGLMKALVVVLAMVAFSFTPVAAADDCKMRQEQIDRTHGKRFDRQASKVRAMATEASRLCKAGNTKEALAMYDQAAKESGSSK